MLPTNVLARVTGRKRHFGAVCVSPMRLPIQPSLALALLLGTLASCSSHLLSDEPGNAPTPATRLRELAQTLRSPDRGAHVRAFNDVYWLRLQIVSAGLSVARFGVHDPQQEEGVRMAMEILGHMRAQDAVPILVDNISFTHAAHPGRAVRRLGVFDNMPAVYPLIQIGLPSLDPVVQKVAETEENIIRERAAIVIDQILGTDMAVLFVRDRRDRERDEVKRQRLDRLLEQIDKVERNRKGKINFGPLRPPPEVKAPPKP